MAKKVYISCPISVSQGVLDKFSFTLGEIPDVLPRFWVRGSKYEQSLFDNSDAYLFILPNNRFECMSGELPIGLKSELKEAYDSGKKIYIGYIAKDGTYNTYSASTNGRDIKGIPGTTHDLYTWATSLMKPIVKVSSQLKSVDLDERLVLMLG